MSDPEISVLTPVRNGAPYLPECIGSVLGQPGVSLEQVVVDGLSTDGTVPFLRSVRDPRLRWVSEADGGPTDALNKAVGLARGEIVGFCNADDRYADGVLQQVTRYFREHPRAAALYGDVRILGPDGDAWTEVRVGRLSYRDLLHARQNAVPYPSAFVRRRILVEVGGFDRTVEYACDYDLFLRIARDHGWHCLPVVLGEFRLHRGSTTIGRIARQRQDADAVLGRYGSDIRWGLRLSVPAKLKLRAARWYFRSYPEARRYLAYRALRRGLMRGPAKGGG